VTENRILRHQLKGRLRLRDGERQALAVIGQKLGKQALKVVAQIVKPETILGWHRTLVAQKCDGSQQRQSPGRPTIDQELEALIVRIAQEHCSWGYDRIVGALANLGLTVSAQTVGNVLKRHGMAPAPERKTTTTWKECIRTHMDVLVATDFFTAEVWTLGGLVTSDVLFFIPLGSRTIHVAGVTPHPNEAWMGQGARNVPLEAWGFLSPGQSLIHDRDTKFCAAFQQIIDDAGVERVVLPPRSPNLMPTRVPGLPRTNNELEGHFRETRRRLLRATGQQGQTQRTLQRQGAWDLLPQPPTEAKFQEAFRQTPPEDLAQERQCFAAHRQRFRLQSRSLRQTPAQVATPYKACKKNGLRKN